MQLNSYINIPQQSFLPKWNAGDLPGKENGILNCNLFTIIYTCRENEMFVFYYWFTNIN